MTERRDVIVIGAGQNGLTCACQLADAGYRVVVLEQLSEPGGMLDVTEFHPGFRAPTNVSWWPYAPDHPFARLRLEQHGLAWVETAVETLALTDTGVVELNGQEQVGSIDDNVVGFQHEADRFAAALRPLLQAPPPINANDATLKRLEAGRLLLGLRRLGQVHLRELLRIATSPFYDWVSEWVDSPALRGALAFDAVLGSHNGPRSPGTVLQYLIRRALAPELRQPVTGSVIPALRQAADARGVFLRTATRVERILVESGQVTGVVLDSGDVVRALRIVSTLDPRTTVNQLVGARHFETGFVTAINKLRGQGNVARLLLALDGEPTISGLSQEQLRQRILIAPDIDGLEQAFDRTKYGESGGVPALELSIPSLVDANLAPAGSYVVCITAMFAPNALRGGWDGTAREKMTRSVLAVLSEHAPELADQIVASALICPPDIERRYNAPGGHWHHVELALDQFWLTRPVAGAARYRLPVDGLYLGGAGAHPGGGISGWNGAHAATALCEDERGA